MKVQAQASLMSAPEQRAQIPAVGIPRSTFDRSHGHKTTLNSGYLVPFYRDEVLPGDTINLKANTFARFATLLAPIMDNVWATTFFFFVPNRLLWDNWERFLGSQDNPGDSTSFVTPKVTVPASTGFWLPKAPITKTVSSITLVFSPVLPIPLTRGHQMLSIPALTILFGINGFETKTFKIPLSSIPITVRITQPITFLESAANATTTLPVVFLGLKGTAVRVPMAQSSVVSNGLEPLFSTTTVQNPIRSSDGTNVVRAPGSAWEINDNFQFGSQTGLMAIGGTINELRMAEAIQTLLERDARGGTRYTELIRQHFGVVSDDGRLQRAELLGMGRQNINIAANRANVRNRNNSTRKPCSASHIRRTSWRFRSFIYRTRSHYRPYLH